MQLSNALLLVGSATAFTTNNNVAQRTGSVQMNIFGNSNNDGEMSQALPFAARPKILDGTLAGDVGFE